MFSERRYLYLLLPMALVILVLVSLVLVKLDLVKLDLQNLDLISLDRGLLLSDDDVAPSEGRLVHEAVPLDLDTFASDRLPEYAPGLSIAERKVIFFEFLLPLVQEENSRLRAVRRKLRYMQEHLDGGRDFLPADRAWVQEIGNRYRVEGENYHRLGFWSDLLERVDEIPEDLVLIQSANESAWGTSRFAREGNSLFGQWCFTPGCGIVPTGRPEGATYEVKIFDTPADAVAAYMHNLNRGIAYKTLRKIRAALREADWPVTAGAMAVGLGRYSVRGQEYVKEVQDMIRTNEGIIQEARLKLASLDSLPKFPKED